MVEATPWNNASEAVPSVEEEVLAHVRTSFGTSNCIVTYSTFLNKWFYNGQSVETLEYQFEIIYWQFITHPE